MKPVIRTASFFSIWLAEFLRHPLLLFGLILGPFLILTLFGRGVDYKEEKPDVILVHAERTVGDERLSVPDQLTEHVNIVAETTDLNAAVRSLRDGDIDGVAVIPASPDEAIADGEHIPIQIFTSNIDPLTVQFTESYLLHRVARLNQQVLSEAIAEAHRSVDDLDQQVEAARRFVAAARGAGGDLDELQRQVNGLQGVLRPLSNAADAVAAVSSSISLLLPIVGSPADEIEQFRRSVEDLEDTVDALAERLENAEASGFPPTDAELDEIDRQLESIVATAQVLGDVPPEVLAAPFELQIENISPFEPTFTGFFSPAVLVLLIQHLGISLAALSMTRIRLFGMMDLLRVAPIRTIEIVNGKYLSYGLVLAAATGCGLAVIWYVLNVPMFGSILQLCALLASLIAISLGAGFLIAMVARNEQHAAQAAMLVLLASVFFSGLIVTLDRIAWPMRAIAMALPSTYAIRTAQDIMLRGVLRHPEDIFVLALGGAALYALTVVALGRQMRAE